MKKDYERLAKKHLKQTKESQKERDKSLSDLQESNTEINRLSGKLVVSRLECPSVKYCGAGRKHANTGMHIQQFIQNNLW